MFQRPGLFFSHSPTLLEIVLILLTGVTLLCDRRDHTGVTSLLSYALTNELASCLNWAGKKSKRTRQSKKEHLKRWCSAGACMVSQSVQMSMLRFQIFHV